MPDTFLNLFNDAQRYVQSVPEIRERTGHRKTLNAVIVEGDIESSTHPYIYATPAVAYTALLYAFIPGSTFKYHKRNMMVLIKKRVLARKTSRLMV